MDELTEAYNEFNNKCQKDIEFLASLLPGYKHDPSEYQRIVGKIEGINVAMENMRAIVVLRQDNAAQLAAVGGDTPSNSIDSVEN